jgi:hypothetical protein
MQQQLTCFGSCQLTSKGNIRTTLHHQEAARAPSSYCYVEERPCKGLYLVTTTGVTLLEVHEQSTDPIFTLYSYAAKRESTRKVAFCNSLGSRRREC